MLGAGVGTGRLVSEGPVVPGTTGAVAPIAVDFSREVKVRDSGAFGAAVPPPPHADSNAVLSMRQSLVRLVFKVCI